MISWGQEDLSNLLAPVDSPPSLPCRDVSFICKAGLRGVVLVAWLEAEMPKGKDPELARLPE